MRIHNLYTDAKGESHFRDIEVEWTEERRGSKLSKKLPATGVIFRETAAEHNVDIRELQGSGISGRVTKQDILGHLEGRTATPAPAKRW
jgi:pyruvate/2-oxoglutarate dehydrogenase complex dihydrolipoamide acyltransferase (E2) component